ncbi:TIGR03668 family PPOX class F420-dependent oxidoreductase [Mycobacterium sp.]|uniref:TIGR03668 family PPOX class F420-dependent oxidoreductase n=1 Tax=Mycobacterium sp. TaxID=1785 RepID=UPI0031E2E475
MVDFDPRAGFAGAPVARLATVGPGGTPHLVPVVFALGGDSGGAWGGDSGGDVVYSAVDAKRKSTQRLRRLANIEGNPRVSMLVDHYSDDWAGLWWVRVDGVAQIHHEGTELHRAYQLLRAKYPQYQTVSLNGPVIAVAVTNWQSWHA